MRTQIHLLPCLLSPLKMPPFGYFCQKICLWAGHFSTSIFPLGGNYDVNNIPLHPSSSFFHGKISKKQVLKNINRKIGKTSPLPVNTWKFHTCGRIGTEIMLFWAEHLRLFIFQVALKFHTVRGDNEFLITERSVHANFWSQKEVFMFIALLDY